MSKPVIIEEHPMTPELARLFEQARRNLLWFDEHVEELEVYKRHRGRYVAAAGGELFVADTPQEVRRLAREKYPDDLPHIRYIPRKKWIASMRVNGEWLRCEDGVIRPCVPELVRAVGGEMVEVTFLLDAGADRTVFSTDFLDLLQPLETAETEQIHLAGVAGEVDSITVESIIGLVRDDGRLVTVRGAFGVFTESESADLSVLGRDVTNNFNVIYDYPGRAVMLLAPPHYYEIKSTS